MSRALCRRLETANSSGGALRTEAGTFVGGMIKIMILINFSILFNDFDNQNNISKPDTHPETAKHKN